ncbi:MAG: ABC transporter permease [Chloroflexi bacterium]|nr:ABC transporter permease [Chloroflexota bacterium]MBP8057995.1 ABC transporter permease [Chloroflexota bacterium]
MKRQTWLTPSAFYYGLFAIILYLPIILLILFSFNDSSSLRFPLTGFTTRWYQDLLQARELLTSLQNSVIVGLISSLVATILGTMAAIAIMRFDFPGKSAFLTVSALPMVIPSVVIGVALLILFRQMINVELSLWTVGLGHVVLNIPTVMLILASRLAGFPANLEEAAMDLGTSYWGAQWRVTLPMCIPALVAAFLTAFTTSFDEYAMSVFIMGTESTLPVYMYSQLRFPRRLPVMVALGALIMVLSIITILLAERLRRTGQGEA